MLYHNIYHHVEKGGGEWVPLGDPKVAFERGDVISLRLIHHEKVLPVDPEDHLLPWPNPISDQNLQTTLPI